MKKKDGKKYFYRQKLFLPGRFFPWKKTVNSMFWQKLANPDLFLLRSYALHSSSLASQATQIHSQGSCSKKMKVCYQHIHTVFRAHKVTSTKDQSLKQKPLSSSRNSQAVLSYLRYWRLCWTFDCIPLSLCCITEA